MQDRELLIDLGDNGYDLVDEAELRKMEAAAMEFDGFTGWRVVGFCDELTKKRKWISVKERLPGQSCVVDVWTKNGRYTAINFAFEPREFWMDYDLTNITEDVTHWMPLPAKPEEA